jgi:hypothetical protein
VSQDHGSRPFRFVGLPAGSYGFEARNRFKAFKDTVTVAAQNLQRM